MSKIWLMCETPEPLGASSFRMNHVGTQEASALKLSETTRAYSVFAILEGIFWDFLCTTSYDASGRSGVSANLRTQHLSAHRKQVEKKALRPLATIDNARSGMHRLILCIGGMGGFCFRTCSMIDLQSFPAVKQEPHPFEIYPSGSFNP